jgi:peroxiredoxin
MREICVEVWQSGISFIVSQIDSRKNMKSKTAAQRFPSADVWIIGAIGVLILGYLIVGRSDSTATATLKPSLPPSAEAGGAPGFTLPDVNGHPVSLADLRGKVVVLDFWATWCPPCKREIPDFIELQSQYGSKGLQVIGIGLDEPEKLKAFALSNGMNYSVLMGTDDIAMKYGGISGIPTTFIIDKSGRIVNRFEGFRSKDVFENEIKRLLL